MAGIQALGVQGKDGAWGYRGLGKKAPKKIFYEMPLVYRLLTFY